MMIDINDLFPEDMSDEAAFCLTEFVLNLGQRVESHCHLKVKRYLCDCRPSEKPEFLNQKKDIDDSF